MKKLLSILLLCLSVTAFAQQYWEDGFWKKEVKKRYESTGSMMGNYAKFYSNGQVEWQGHCDNTGKPDSIWVYYDKDGKKFWEGRYNGIMIMYDPVEDYSDTLAWGTYRDGLRDGLWTLQQYGRKTTGYYYEGNPIGNWTEYRELMKVVSMYVSSTYDYNTQTKTIYDEKGNVTRTEQKDSAEFRDDLNNFFYTDDFEYGNFDFAAIAQYPDFSRLNNYFLQPGYTGLKTPLISGGIGFTVIQDKVYQGYYVSYMPGIAAQMNDSVKLNLMAYSLSANYGGDFIPAEWIDIVASVGIGFQQLRLKVSYTKPVNEPSEYSLNEGSFKIYKNPSPFVQGLLQLRLNFGEISLSGSAGYMQDCSGAKWRYNGRYLSGSPRTSVSGFTGMATIGIHFN